jgi:hypothetical protein
MSLSFGVSRSVRRSPTPWRSVVAMITLLLSACSPLASGSTTASPRLVGLSASSSGVCQAIVALPDVSAAERAFTNLAHEALHGLAADPRLERALSARVLEAMAKVEADFARSADAATMTADLTELQDSAEAALRALGLEAPACVP